MSKPVDSAISIVIIASLREVATAFEGLTVRATAAGASKDFIKGISVCHDIIQTAADQMQAELNG